ncbi:Uu.00g093970.m01.CDS01 [Anthostomella pinea]|uniref:Uu.00g093970.m01.CDS01 n=1 Tax=Anthostomella pinea TaxID=933095 RepID=A0AAI8VNJ4_9PEZI|nr:Uu.00g093970.m01.CDS01 [Anthostomella pinea]
MPPRKKPNTPTANGKSKQSTTPASRSLQATRRSTRARRLSDLVDSDESLDELCATKARGGAIDAEVRDEITAYPSHPKRESHEDTANNHVSQDQPADAITVQTPRSEASSTKDGSAGKSRLTRGTPMKKQEFDLTTAAGDDEDELAEAEPVLKKPKIIVKQTQAPGARKSRSKWDNLDEMLTNPNSPLVKTNLRDLLCSPKAWGILSAEEKQQVLAKFPGQDEILDAGTDAARPDIAALRNNNHFRHDVARYQESLRLGRHDPEWIHQAQQAHQKRRLGLYDEFLAARFEEDWEMPLPGKAEESQAEPEVEPEVEVEGKVEPEVEFEEKLEQKLEEKLEQKLEEKLEQEKDQAQEQEHDQMNGQEHEARTNGNANGEEGIGPDAAIEAEENHADDVEVKPKADEIMGAT